MLSWLKPVLSGVVELSSYMMLSSRGRHVKLFAGELVKNKGVPSSGHWICASDWNRFKEHADKETLPTTGTVGMIEFYRWVKETPCSCGFTVVAQEMDEEQYERLSWRLHPLAT